MMTRRGWPASSAGAARNSCSSVAHAITKSKCELNVSMLAESVVLEGESQELFLELLAEIDGEFQPESPG